jgi:predicted regulator of Ras-like GTPase activity (Roadblock/LC7/MglB family)
MGAFGQVLAAVARKVPEARAVMIMGNDGIPVEKVVVGGDASAEAVAAELTTVLASSLARTADTDLGMLQEMTMVTEGMTALVMAISPEYHIFVAMAPGGVAGRARAAMRVACLELEREFA